MSKPEDTEIKTNLTALTDYPFFQRDEENTKNLHQQFILSKDVCPL